jgi:2-dehydropantoate 2-reductase
MDEVQSGFDAEVYSHSEWHKVDTAQFRNPDRQRYPEEAEEDDFMESTIEDIDCLIVCSKANVCEKAIETLKHRLTPNSTICLVQNGMGVIEKLNERLFPRLNDRPQYIETSFSHYLLKQHPFHIAHITPGTFILSPAVTDRTPLVEAERDTHWIPSTKYLLRLLTLTPQLVATVETPAGLLQYRLERQVINCIIGPLTAINDCANGELLYVYSATRLMRLLLFEISSVICALPELQGIPGIQSRYSPERLRRTVVHAISKTAPNTSSMLQDVRDLKITEIEYFNGWIVRRGEELGLKCVLNYMVKHMVQTKLVISMRRENSAVPLDLENVIVTGDPRIDD